MRYNKYKKPPIFARMVMVLLLISPILHCYGWGKFDFSFIIMSFLSCWHLLIHGIRNSKVPFLLFCYFGWWYISHVLSSTSFGELLPLGLIRIVITYMVYIDLFDFHYFMSKYKKIVGFVILYFYIQEIGRIFVGFKLPSILPFLPFAVTDDVQSFVQANIDSVRSSSLFKEPAVFAQYLLPFLCYEMFAPSQRRNWKYIILLTITLLWSRSGNAMVGLITLAVCYGVQIFKNQKGFKKFGYFIFSGIFVLGVLTIFFKTEGGQKIMERTITIDSESTIDKGYPTSTFMRIYQGFYIFNEYSSYYKIVGNDHNSYIQERAFSSSIISSLYKKREFVSYFNTFYNVLIYTGFIGFFLIFLFFCELWKGNTFCGKSMMLLLFMISLISANYFNEIMTLFLLPIIGMRDYTNKFVIKQQ